MTILNTSVSGMLADSELAVVDLAECRQRQHDRLQEPRNRLFDPGRPGRQRRPRTAAACRRATVSLNSLQGNVVSSRRRPISRSRAPASSSSPTRAGDLYLTRNGSFVARRLRQPGQQRRLLPDGRQRSERPFAVSANSLSSLQKVNVDSAGLTAHGDDLRLARRQSALDGDADRRRRPAIDQHRELDLYRRDLARRLRQSRRRAHRSISISPTPAPNTWEVDAYDASNGRPAAAFPIRPVRSRPRP